jgi:hypothetical protein
MLKERYDKLEKVNYQVCHFLGVMKSNFKILDKVENGEDSYYTKEQAIELLISSLRKEVDELDNLIFGNRK